MIALAILLAITVSTTGDEVVVSNPGTEAEWYTIQIGEGVAEEVLFPGQSKAWHGDGELNDWQVWQDGVLLAYGVLGEPEHEPAPVEKVVAHLGEEKVSPDVRVFSGPWELE